MDWIILAVVVSIPLLLNILALIGYHGTFRRAAFLVLPLTTFASLGDIYSASQKGNLTGLLTILISGPALLVLALLGLGNLIQKRKNNASNSLEQTDAEESRIKRSIQGAISGALLAVSGLILISLVSGLFNIGRGIVASLWLRNDTGGYIAWGVVAILGAIAGGGSAFFHHD